MDMVNAVYSRYQSIVGEIDIKGDSLKPWQVAALNELAVQVEGVLAGSRRKSDRQAV